MLITADEFLEPLGQVADQLIDLQTLVLVDEPRSPLPNREHIAFADLLSDEATNPRRAE